MANTPLKCIAGKCPVVGCDRDGECYLWRCENPHAPSPRLVVTLKAAAAAAFIFVAFGIVGRVDADDAEQHARELKERLPVYRPTIPATFSPRCPKENSAGEPLRLSIAQRRDREANWMYYCSYYSVEGIRL